MILSCFFWGGRQKKIKKITTLATRWPYITQLAMGRTLESATFIFRWLITSSWRYLRKKVGPDHTWSPKKQQEATWRNVKKQAGTKRNDYVDDGPRSWPPRPPPATTTKNNKNNKNKRTQRFDKKHLGLPPQPVTVTNERFSLGFPTKSVTNHPGGDEESASWLGGGRGGPVLRKHPQQKTHRQVSTAWTTSILDGGVSAPPTPETSHGLASGRKAPKGAGKRVTLRSTKRDVTGGWWSTSLEKPWVCQWSLVGGFNPFGNLPQIGVKIKNIWNHQPDQHGSFGRKWNSLADLWLCLSPRTPNNSFKMRSDSSHLSLPELLWSV